MRPSVDLYFSRMAQLVASRATCRRRSVGCVLVNARRHVVATGYNGAARGQPHCLDKPCAGADQLSGTRLELCEAVHAEQNALLQCGDVNAVDVAYVTVFPCVHCVKLLLNTSCRKIVALAQYSQPEAERLWRMAEREITWFTLMGEEDHGKAEGGE